VLTVRLFDSRPVAPFVAYAACFAVIWGLIGLEPDLRVGEIAVALALQVLVGVVLVRLGRRNPRQWAALVGMVAFLASVVLLRDGVGPTPRVWPAAVAAGDLGGVEKAPWRASIHDRGGWGRAVHADRGDRGHAIPA
jgi:hypothetical protein